MHSVVARAPGPFDRRVAPDPRRAPSAYRLVAGAFAALETAARALPRGDDGAAEPARWRRFRSALNGVVGHDLAARDNALAIRLGLRRPDGAAADASVFGSASPAGRVLFVHGLCLSELEWQTPAHRAFVAQLERAGYGVGWLRYNTGRPLHENGLALAELLESLAGPDGPRWVLIGHSMGGLVIRSACGHAAERRHAWLSRLGRAAYLGTPHHGAPLERAGVLANAALGLSPYSAALMRLGDVRSPGIKDLGRPALGPLVAHVDHLLIAGSLPRASAVRWIGDGLVPVASALGEHRDPGRRLAAPRLERARIEPLGHVAMLGDERVYRLLARWLLGD
jgi:hypothetical protein